MTDLLFNLTIGPLQLIYEILYNGLVSITHNYGWALILLSFVTTLITVPLGKAVSNHIRKERLIESILDPQIKKIKATSTGAEQSKRIRNLYKRYSYNPLYSIRLAFGVLIQLPFLIGAYWMIAEHPSLSGISFGPIADLSQPDKLLGGINVLPLIMTAANLGVVAISAQMPKRDRIQALVIAILFLVLLYSAPSALLIYWTTNNILLLIRAILQKSKLSLNLHSQSYHFSNVWIWWIVTYIVAILATITTTPFFGFSDHRIEIIKAFTDTIFYVLLLCLIANIVSNEIKQTPFRFLIPIVLLLFFSFRTFGYWIYDLDRAKLTTQFCLALPLLFILYRLNYRKALSFVKSLNFSDIGTLYLSSVLLIGVLVLFYFPVTIYLSDIDAIGGNFVEISTNLIKYALTFLVSASLLWLLIKPLKLLRIICGIFIALLSLTFVVYGFIVVPDYGTINEFAFQIPSFLYQKNNLLFDLITITIIATIFAILIILNRLYVLKYCFFVISLVCLFIPIYNAQSLNLFGNNNIEKKLDRPNVLAELNDFYSFSQSGKNIVVVMLDTFTGGNVREIFQAKPELKKEFNGFVWYEDHVSSGSSTIFGKPALLGGENFEPYKLSIDQTKTLEQKINEGWGKNLRKLQEHNFDISFSDTTWLDESILKKELKFPAKIYDYQRYGDFLQKLWLGQENVELNEVWIEGFLTSYGLFAVSPLSIKQKIYKNGQWMGTVDIVNQGFKHNLKWWSQFDTLNKISTVKEKSSNSFIWIDSELTHHPWQMSDTCIPSKDPPNLSRINGVEVGHLRNEICSFIALSNWFKWMKERGVYDNTRIILISDHDGWNSSRLYYLFNKNYPIERPHALLMVKDFDSNSEFSTNSAYLTHASDVPAFILKNYENSSQQPWKNTQRTRCLAHGDWQRSRHNLNFYNIKYNLCIKGTLFNKDNWIKTPGDNISTGEKY